MADSSCVGRESTYKYLPLASIVTKALDDDKCAKRC